MLFSNVFNGLTQVAKSVVGLIKGGQIEPVTFYEHDLQPLAPTVEPLLVTSEAIEEWKDCVWKYSDQCRVQISKDGKIRLLNNDADEWKLLECSWKQSLSIFGCNIPVDGKVRIVNVATVLLDTYVGRPAYLEPKLPLRIYTANDGNEKNCTLDNIRWLTKQEIDSQLAVQSENARNGRAKVALARQERSVNAKNIEQELAAKRAKKEEAEKQRLAKIEQDIQKEVDRQFDAEFDELLDSLAVEQDEAQASHERRVDKVLSGVEKIEVKAEDKQVRAEDIQPKFDGNIDFQKAMREEIWLEIPTYEGAYEISSFGNVRSIGRFVTRHRIVKVKNGTEEERRPYQYFQVGKRLKPSMMDGVLEISLSKGGKQSRLSVAKLVLVVFAKDKLKSANFNVIHLNGNLNNCRLNNLLIADEAQAA